MPTPSHKVGIPFYVQYLPLIPFQTRSGTEFSSWDRSHVAAINPSTLENFSNSVWSGPKQQIMINLAYFLSLSTLLRNPLAHPRWLCLQFRPWSKPYPSSMIFHAPKSTYDTHNLHSPAS